MCFCAVFSAKPESDSEKTLLRIVEWDFRKLLLTPSRGGEQE